MPDRVFTIIFKVCKRLGISHTVNTWDGEEFMLTFSLQLRRDAIAIV